MKYSVITILFLLAGCSVTKVEPICTATYHNSGMDYSVNIYDFKIVNNRTYFKAGYPFNWTWVSKSNFKDSTCNINHN